MLRAPPWITLAFAAFVLWRLGRPLLAGWHGADLQRIPVRLKETIAMRVWAPHAATIVIGITFAQFSLNRNDPTREA